MQLSSLLFVLALPVIALACEGDCIVDVTNVWFGNYTNVVTNVLRATNHQFSNRLGEAPTFESQGDTLGPFEPFLSAFKEEAEAIIRKAIFPDLFHGKCQRKGVEPEGCPKPDCPVICGTPGSMVHFYPRLVEAVFRAVFELLRTYTDKHSEPYKKVQQNLASHPRPCSLRFARATFYPGEAESVSASGFLKRTANPQVALKNSVDEIPTLLDHACYGLEREVGVGHELKHCSWGPAMKEYILTFP